MADDEEYARLKQSHIRVPVAAKILGVDAQAVWNMVHDGHLPFVKSRGVSDFPIYLVSREAVADLKAKMDSFS